MNENQRQIKVEPEKIPLSKISDKLKTSLKIKRFRNVNCEPIGPPNQCYQNVHQKVLKDDGEAIYGWKLLKVGGVFREFVHHCIWKSEKGKYVCITKPPNSVASSKKVAFYECDDWDWGEGGVGGVPNHMISIDKRLDISRFRNAQNDWCRAKKEMLDLLYLRGCGKFGEKKPQSLHKDEEFERLAAQFQEKHSELIKEQANYFDSAEVMGIDLH
ncbi:MAG: hypothetical protein AAGD04_05025 [Pseudomonadota bacterium]